MEEVVGAAGFGADAAEAAAAEGLAGDEGAGAAAVDVEVADAEVAFGFFDVGGFAGEDAAGEFEFRGVGDIEGFVEGAGVHDGEDRAEDFFFADFVVHGDAGEDVGRDVVAAGFFFEAGGDGEGEFERALAFAGFDVVQDGGFGAGIDDGADVSAWQQRIADGEGSGGFDEAFDEDFGGFAVGPGGIDDDAAGAGGAFLALEAEGGVADAEDGFVEIGAGVDDDGVFAAHLADDFLDVALAVGDIGHARGLEDVEADFERAGEGNERGARITNECGTGG